MAKKADTDTANKSDGETRSRMDGFKHHLTEARGGIILILVALFLFIGGGTLGYMYASDAENSSPRQPQIQANSQTEAEPQEETTVFAPLMSEWVNAEDLRNDCLNSRTDVSLSTPRELNRCLFDGIISKCAASVVPWDCYDIMSGLLSRMADRVAFPN